MGLTFYATVILLLAWLYRIRLFLGENVLRLVITVVYAASLQWLAIQVLARVPRFSKLRNAIQYVMVGFVYLFFIWAAYQLAGFTVPLIGQLFEIYDLSSAQ